MAERKGLSKKIRFEVFKRDSFTCQYCGKSAPEVVLEVDHIMPVAQGGDNHLTNLVTACFDCNRGKKDKTLDDNSVVIRQQKQLSELNERKQQLEMVMQWRKELERLEIESVNFIADYIESKINKSVTELGRQSISKWISKYDIKTLVEAINKAISAYSDDGEKIMDKIPKIAHYILNPMPKWKSELYYIRGIARNKCNYFNDRQAIIWLTQLHDLEADMDYVKQEVLECRNWSDFKNIMIDLINIHQEIADDYPNYLKWLEETGGNNLDGPSEKDC